MAHTLRDSLGRYSRDGKGQLSLEERFWPKVARRSDSECWLWIGAKTKRGYGTLSFRVNGQRKRLLAHRASVMVSGRTIPAGLEVMHTCDVPGCVNPTHLQIATHAENMRDAFAKGITTPVKSRISLPYEHVLEIRASVEDVHTLAARYRVTPQHIGRIRNGRQRKAA